MKISFFLIVIFFLYSICPVYTQLLQQEDFEYRGAFRLPDVEPFEESWNWGGSAMTYYPGGDPAGPKDGYSGSIFGVGHDWNMYVSEISIPVPVVSKTKNLNELNTAATIQGFHNVREDLFQDQQGSEIFYEIIRVGIEYLPAQGSQTSGKLHFAWGQHFQEERQDPSHMWCELDLSNPNPKGGWFFENYTNYCTNDYLFEIPQAWSDVNTPGQRLATGRFRDGLWSGRGPALFSYQPFQNDNPAGNTILNLTPLMLYGDQDPGERYITAHDSISMNGFKEADEWAGGAWITSGENSSVIFAGTKGIGNCWYGLPNGYVWTHTPADPPDPNDQRGWWCDRFNAQIIFFNPDDLAKVAKGQMKSWEPQPYDTLDIDPYLFSVDSTKEKNRIGAVCYDRTHGFLYISERLADDDKPLIHVFVISDQTNIGNQETLINDFELYQNFPNPFNPETTIKFFVKEPCRVILKIYDLMGREVAHPVNRNYQSGKHYVNFNASEFSSGVYFYRIRMGEFREVRKMVVVE
jgi:hypothetical protein